MKLLDDVGHKNYPCVQICHWRTLIVFYCTVAVTDDHRPAESYLTLVTSPCSDIFKFQPIQPSEVLSALQGLDIKKSAAQMVSQHFLLQIYEIVTEPLTLIYNQSLEKSGYWNCSFGMEMILYI